MPDQFVSAAHEEFEQAFEAARQGPRDARLAFFDHWAPTFLKVIRATMDAKVRSAADSTDFMQEVRLELLRHEFADGALETPQALVGYMVKIATGVVLQAKRKMGRLKRGGGLAPQSLARLSPAEQEQLADDAPSPAEAAAFDEIWRRVLAPLPLVYQHVAIRIREGYTHEEIAAAMNLSLRTVGRVRDKVEEAWLAEEAKGD